MIKMLRYVERNALRAELVSRAQDWKWSSLPGWERGDPLLWRDALVRETKLSAKDMVCKALPIE